jgi:hypothetical protein
VQRPACPCPLKVEFDTSILLTDQANHESTKTVSIVTLQHIGDSIHEDPEVARLPPTHDRLSNTTYQKHGVCVLARLGYRIKVMIRISIELRSFVLDARVRHGVNWLDCHGVLSVRSRVKRRYIATRVVGSLEHSSSGKEKHRG